MRNHFAGRRGIIIPAVLLLSLIAPAAGRASEPPPVRVGAAQTDITWHVGADRIRQLHPDLPADPTTFAGLHTRPRARAIVIEGASRIAVVRTDTILITGDLHEAVAQRVAALGITPNRLILAATHTHVSNNGMFPHPAHGAFYRSSDPREYSFLADRIAEAIAKAILDLRPARLAAGSGSVMLPAVNRRYTDRESLGSRPFANDPERLDPELGVLRFDDARTGEPIAVLMNYGLHPVVLIDNPLVSADWVAWAERGVEAAFARGGRTPMAMFMNGAEGDQDPIYVRYSYPQAEWTGRILAREAARVALSLSSEPLVRAAVAHRLVPMPPPGTPLPSWQPAGPRVPATGPEPLLIPSSVRLDALGLWTPSQSTALLTWPGEPIRDIGVRLKTAVRALGFDKAFVLGLANDWAGYFVTPEEYDRGGYEASTFNFYGRESAPYLEGHLLDLARALADGVAPDQPPLPPNAQADRVLMEAIAAAAAQVSGPLSAGEMPPPDSPVSVVEQPAGLARPGVAAFEWVGASPDVQRGWIPRVKVQRATDAGFVTVAREGTGDILLYQSTPAPEDHHWRAVWEALPDAPRGTYRFLVEGTRQDIANDLEYTLASEPFEVRACTCLGATIGSTLSPGGTTVRVEADYAAPAGGFRLIDPRVATGHATVAVIRAGEQIAGITLDFASRVLPVARAVSVHDVSGRDLPVTIDEPTETGAFEGLWTGPTDVSFELLSVEDAFGNTA